MRLTSTRSPARTSSVIGRRGPAGKRYHFSMNDQHYLDDILVQLRKLKAQADKAVAQVADPQLFATLDAESNSIAVLMKHVAGNMRSRWTDFLTTDGEKPDRDRDSEFVEPAATRAELMTIWEAGWDC